jgi:outer membrane autotransporter protein
MIKRLSLVFLAFSGFCFANMSGFLVGGQAGMTMFRGTHTFTANGASTTKNVNRFGFSYGVQGGYIYELGNRNFVGGEGYFTYANPSATQVLQINTGTPQGKATLNHTRAYGLKAFYGMMMNQKISVYAHAGMEFQTYELKYTELTYGSGSESYKSITRAFGAGVGAFYILSDRVWLAAEYAYMRGKKIQPQPLNRASRSYALAPSQHKLIFKVYYKF